MKTLMVNTQNPRALAQIIERIEKTRNTTALDGSNPNAIDGLILVDEIYRLRKELDVVMKQKDQFRIERDRSNEIAKAALTPKGTLVLRSNT